MHCYFLRAGNADLPIELEVDPIRNGRSFCTRRVVARQNGEAIFNTSISYHVEEEGMSHSLSMPEVISPEEAAAINAERDQNLPKNMLDLFGVERERITERLPEAKSRGSVVVQSHRSIRRLCAQTASRVSNDFRLLALQHSFLRLPLRATRESVYWCKFGSRYLVPRGSRYERLDSLRHLQPLVWRRTWLQPRLAVEPGWEADCINSARRLDAHPKRSKVSQKGRAAS